METTVARGEALAQAEREGLGDIWSSSEADDNLVHLCDRIGDRWAGSTAPAGGHAPHRREKFGWALANGAVGFLFVNQNPGMMAITGALAAGYEGELPSLGLPRESGDYLRRLLESGPVKLRIKIE